ncbi:MAG TPA: AAA family ATPase, partial [Candidatus Tectomicrobia bacterium]
MAISEATSRLAQGYFECQDLGAQTLRGVAEPLHVYQVLSESGVHSRLDIASARGLTPLVGREQEVGVLLERWEQAKAGHGHVVLLSGEAGIGKSRLVQTLKDHVAHEPYTRWECRSAEYYENTALFPLVELFQRLVQFHAEDTLDEKVGKLEQVLRQYRLPVEETMPLFASLLSLPLAEEHYAPLALSPQRQRQKTLETLVAILLERAEHQPLLFILEDLHWTDPTTLEWLHLLIEQTPTASMLVLLTCRPHFQPAWHHRSYLTEMTLNRLSHVQLEQIVAGMTDGKTFPAEVLQQLSAKTDGVPLFVEEITKSLLESGQLTAVDGHYELIGSLSTFAIPATLQDSLMARLDRLVTAKGVAQMGATIGRQFAYDVLQAVAQLDESLLQRELGRLVEAEIVYQRGVPPQAIYTFKHALIQDAAYQSLLRSTRQQYHQRIAQALEAQFPETVATQPELLAQHYTEAGRIEPAMGYWQRAGQRALQGSAYAEAVAHLTQGLAVLTTLPETPARLQQELDLQVALGPALLATKGHAAPDVERAYSRARELCAQVGDTPQLFPVLRGLMLYYQQRGDIQTASQLGEQLLRLAQTQPDPAPLLLAYYALGNVLFLQGEPAAARTHHTQALALYDPQAHRALAVRYGQDLGMGSHGALARALWQLGYPDQALQHSQAACTLAQEVAHPYSLVLALVHAATVHQYRREVLTVHAQAAAAMTLATEQGFFAERVAWATVLHGWALAMQGQGEAGLA